MAVNRLPLDEFARLPSFYGVNVSYQSDRAAFYADYSGRIELWTLDLRSGAKEQVSHGEVPRAVHAGSPGPATARRSSTPRIRAATSSMTCGASISRSDRHPTHRCATAQEYVGQASPDGRWLSFQSNRAGR